MELISFPGLLFGSGLRAYCSVADLIAHVPAAAECTSSLTHAGKLHSNTFIAALTHVLYRSESRGRKARNFRGSHYEAVASDAYACHTGGGNNPSPNYISKCGFLATAFPIAQTHVGTRPSQYTRTWHVNRPRSSHLEILATSTMFPQVKTPMNSLLGGASRELRFISRPPCAKLLSRFVRLLTYILPLVVWS